MFRTLLDVNEEPLVKNYRQVQSIKNRPVFHISPSTFLNSTLLSFPKYTTKVNPASNKTARSPRPSSSFQSQKDVCYVRDYIRSPFENKRKYDDNYAEYSCMCNN